MESNKLLSRPHEVCVKEDATADASGFDGSFWRATVPRLLRQNASVWYANLAIHALIDAKRPDWAEDGAPPSGASYRRALRYHGLALGQLRKEAMSRGSLQSATVCCLFFVIFEVMSCDEKAAQLHMYNGCKMMDELQRNVYGPSWTGSGIEDMLCKELRQALRFLALQVHGPSQGVSQGLADGFQSESIAVATSDGGYRSGS